MILVGTNWNKELQAATTIRKVELIYTEMRKNVIKAYPFDTTIIDTRQDPNQNLLISKF